MAAARLGKPCLYSNLFGTLNVNNAGCGSRSTGGAGGRCPPAKRCTFGWYRAGSLFERPIPERHRIIFYVGHLEAFDWNLLHENVFGLKSFHPEFDRLFAFGIDPVGGGLPSDQPSDWPSLMWCAITCGRIRGALDEKLARKDSLESRSVRATDFPSTRCSTLRLSTG